MRETLIVVGLLVLAVGLRSSRKGLVRKLGALGFLAASYCLFYFLTGNAWEGLIGVAIWFFLPWIELLTRIRRMRLPVVNHLEHREVPNPSWFPNAVQAAAAMDEAGFEHVSDCGWDWDGMQQNFRLFWHPEERAVAAVCLCEQSDVAFAFITVTSTDAQGRIWRTTNFPFAPTLRCPPDVRWNHVPCSRNCFHQILRDHHKYLETRGIAADSLRIPDPDRIEETIETEMRRQVDHNLATGIITLTDDGSFRYTTRGLFFLWGQFVKDMVRFC
ncbi:MAG: hypothetical protein H7A49_01280 [Akkermansiaceae bacterium]|nr:hypothetical protein [Akkermansiaceae bacterium]MCP5542517.1 hypothetical protein [Akkermansiaceae bacterium]MCP5545948.1 hypothetical protein [Akkermansiaceae bacterium]